MITSFGDLLKGFFIGAIITAVGIIGYLMYIGAIELSTILPI